MPVNNKLVDQKTSNTFSAFLAQDGVKKRINDMIGGKEGQRFIASIVSAVSVNPTLQQCQHGSILSSALLGESLNLSPSPQLGQYYIVPYGDKATFQLGYKGYIQLAIRSGYYKKLNVVAIKEGELVKYDPMTEEIEVNIIENDEEREKAETIGYYAMFEYLNGFRKTMYWSKKKMEAHARKYSPAYAKDIEKGTKYSFWSKGFDGMAFKTMLRQLISKWGIMSIELEKAYTEDNSGMKNTEEIDYIDMNTKPENEVQAEAVDEVEPETEPEDGGAFAGAKTKKVSVKK